MKRKRKMKMDRKRRMKRTTKRKWARTMYMERKMKRRRMMIGKRKIEEEGRSGR